MSHNSAVYAYCYRHSNVTYSVWRICSPFHYIISFISISPYPDHNGRTTSGTSSRLDDIQAAVQVSRVLFLCHVSYVFILNIVSMTQVILHEAQMEIWGHLQKLVLNTFRTMAQIQFSAYVYLRGWLVSILCLWMILAQEISIKQNCNAFYVCCMLQF